MRARLELTDGGKTFWCFNRRGTRQDDVWNINGACGPKDIEPGSEVSQWISQMLAERNSNPDPCFIWLDPHAARLLWFEDVLPGEQIPIVAENGRRRFKDVCEGGECFVWPDVSFTVDGHIVKLTVVISSRTMHDQVSIVEGEIPPEGVIDLGRMTKQTKAGIV